MRKRLYSLSGLTSAADNRGNRAQYTLDANGNRLSTAVKTDSGAGLDGQPSPSDTAKTSAQAMSIDNASNRLLGFVQTQSLARGGQSLASATSPVDFSLDAAGNLTHDGASGFDYDSANRPAQARIRQGGEAFKVAYLHNALGQRVFKSEAQAIQGLPNEAELGAPFIAWLKARFAWLFAPAQTNAMLGQSYVYAEGALPGHALLGEYGNGGNASAASGGSAEYIWLPTDDGNAMPVGVVRGGQLYAVHSDHLATPRLITDSGNKPVWQWPYSAFGDNQPTGVLQATPVLQATKPPMTYNLRYPGQYFDEEAKLLQNYFRSNQAAQGRYTQADPIGLGGGLNRFGYVGGNPLSYTDPEGLSPKPDWWNKMWAPPDTSKCVTAECAAGLLPAPPDNRTQPQIDYGQCKVVCNIAAAVPVAACNAAFGGGIPGAILGAAGRMSVCAMVCK